MNGRAIRAAVALAIAALTPVDTVKAQERDTLTLADALRQAAQGNPMLRAARLGAVAAAERVGPAGALPDPQLQLGFMNRMLSEPFSSMDPMTMDQVQLMQMLPWPGKLRYARRAARRAAAARELDTEEQGRMLEAEVRMAYFEVAAADRALEVMDRTRALLREFQNVATTMYAVGSAVQQDVLRAQVEVARMTEEITRMQRERVTAAARLNVLLGRVATAPIAAVELPAPLAPIPTADSLVTLAQERRSALRAGTERIAAADAALAAARREIFPDFQVGVQLQRRPAFPDMASLMVGLSLPLFAGSRQLPMRREMAAMRDMAAAELEDLRNRTAGRLVELQARAEQDAKLVALYRSSIVPQSEAAVQASLASYRVGRVTFMDVVENQMTVNRYLIETYRLTADYHQAIGEIEALVGPLEGSNP